MYTSTQVMVDSSLEKKLLLYTQHFKSKKLSFLCQRCIVFFFRKEENQSLGISISICACQNKVIGSTSHQEHFTRVYDKQFFLGTCKGLSKRKYTCCKGVGRGPLMEQSTCWVLSEIFSSSHNY